MGVPERIAQIQVEAAARKLAEEQEAERIRKETEAAILQTQALKAQQDADRIATIMADLFPILEAVKAREQLEMVKDQVWRVGEVDSKPAPILGDNKNFHKLALSLRARYNAVESTGGEWEGGVAPSSDEVFISVEAVNDGGDGISGVWVHSGLSNRHNSFGAPGYYIRFGGVSLEQPKEAYDTLEEMLAEACIQLDSRGSVSAFLDSQEQHFKSFGFGEKQKQTSTQLAVKPPWYKRI